MRDAIMNETKTIQTLKLVVWTALIGLLIYMSKKKKKWQFIVLAPLLISAIALHFYTLKQIK